MRLADLGRRIGVLTRGEVRPCLVLPQGVPPADPTDVPVLHDVDGEVHRLYGAQGGALHLVRPDGYVAHRARPPDDRGLLEHLGAVFDGDVMRAPGTAQGVPANR